MARWCKGLAVGFSCMIDNLFRRSCQYREIFLSQSINQKWAKFFISKWVWIQFYIWAEIESSFIKCILEISVECNDEVELQHYLTFHSQQHRSSSAVLSTERAHSKMFHFFHNLLSSLSQDHMYQSLPFPFWTTVTHDSYFCSAFCILLPPSFIFQLFIYTLTVLQINNATLHYCRQILLIFPGMFLFQSFQVSHYF